MNSRNLLIALVLLFPITTGQEQSLQQEGCGVGYFSVYPDPTNCECEICPIGTYNDKENAQSCTPCSSGYTTSEEGSTSSSHCHIECDKGYFRHSTNAVDQCIPCPVGTYSESGNAIACTDCPTGYTTSQEGSYDSALCTGCMRGYVRQYYSRECVPCPLHTYSRTVNATYCTACPFGSKNSQEGSTTCEECIRGFFRDSANNRCVACPVGTYSETDNADSCTDCPTGYTTFRQGTDRSSQCYKCIRGYYKDSNYRCTACLVGTYSDSSFDESCTSCPSGYTTLQEGSDNSILCSVCNRGYFRDSTNNVCAPCKVGTYSDTINAESCTTCPIGHNTTRQQASNHNSQCTDLQWCTSGIGPPRNNGYTVYPSPRPVSQPGFPDGYNVSFGCEGSRTLVGPTGATCQNGRWSHQPESCEITCPPLSLANGMIDYNQSAMSGRYLANTVATFWCDSGYIINGPNSKTCQSSGNWNEQTPTCEDFYRPFLPPPAIGVLPTLDVDSY